MGAWHWAVKSDLGSLWELGMRLKNTAVAGPREVTFGDQELESLGKEVKKDALNGLALSRRTFPIVSIRGRKRCFWLGARSQAEPAASETRPAGRARGAATRDQSETRAEVALGQGLSGQGTACNPRLWHLTQGESVLISLTEEGRSCSHNPNLKKTKSEARERGVSATVLADNLGPGDVLWLWGKSCYYSPRPQTHEKSTPEQAGAAKPAPRQGLPASCRSGRAMAVSPADLPVLCGRVRTTGSH